MKVSELISQLAQMDPNSTVRVHVDAQDRKYSIYEVGTSGSSIHGWAMTVADADEVLIFIEGSIG